jgi:hypothetical protein
VKAISDCLRECPLEVGVARSDEPGALGERILADQVVGMLTVTRDIYGDGVKQ